MEMKNLRFILGLACTLGGALFRETPKIVKAVQERSPDELVIPVVKQVL